jgi:putative transposase
LYRTIKVKLELRPEEKASLLLTLEDYSKVFSLVCQWSFENQKCGKMAVHRATYFNCRSMVPNLPSSLVESAKDVACEVMKRIDMKMRPKRKKRAAIRYSSRSAKAYLEGGYLSLSSSRGRIQAPFNLAECYHKYLNTEVRGGVLWYNKTMDCFFFGIIVFIPKPSFIEEGEVLGVDRGLKYAAVTSKNQFFLSNHIRNIKGKFAHLRAQLQAKGTRSAKRKLRKLSGRERRFITCQNHSIAKQIVNSCQRALAIEDLHGINSDRATNKWFGRRLSNWSFYQLEFFINYKAEEQGKRVISINPQYTSQKCSKCGHIDSKNRIKGGFHCLKCPCDLNADINAARNIAQIGKSELSRLPTSKPNATSFPYGLETPRRKEGNDSCESGSEPTDNRYSEFRKSKGSFTLGYITCFQEGNFKYEKPVGVK